MKKQQQQQQKKILLLLLFNRRNSSIITITNIMIMIMMTILDHNNHYNSFTTSMIVFVDATTTAWHKRQKCPITTRITQLSPLLSSSSTSSSTISYIPFRYHHHNQKERIKSSSLFITNTNMMTKTLITIRGGSLMNNDDDDDEDETDEEDDDEQIDAIITDKTHDTHSILYNENNETKIADDGVIIISFNVGGTIYRIPKALLQRYPDTMLYMAASNIETSNDDNPIIIERNGQGFQYIIDYMRNDSMNDDMIDSLDSSSETAFFQDMIYYGFVPIHHDIYFPKDVMNLDGVDYQSVVWDVSVASAGLIFENENQDVTVTRGSKLPLQYNTNGVFHPSTQSWQSVMGIVGYDTGVHYWNFEIIEDDEWPIMIGVSRSENIVTQFHSLGHSSENLGIGYLGNTGNIYFRGTCHTGAKGKAFGPTFGKGDVIGTLLNMNRRTVTFYKNGVRIGTAGTSNSILGNTKYYPCVSFSSSLQKIRCIGRKQIFT